MKRYWLSLLLLLCLATPTLAQTPSGTVVVNGRTLQGVGFLSEGTAVWYPAVAILQALGRQVSWDEASNTLLIDGQPHAVSARSVGSEAYMKWNDLSVLAPEVRFGVSGDKAVFDGRAAAHFVVPKVEDTPSPTPAASTSAAPVAETPAPTATPSGPDASTPAGAWRQYAEACSHCRSLDDYLAQVVPLLPRYRQQDQRDRFSRLTAEQKKQAGPMLMMFLGLGQPVPELKVDSTDIHGSQAELRAQTAGKRIKVKLLLEAGTWHVDEQEFFSDNPLHAIVEAVDFNDLDEVKAMLAKDPTLIKVRDTNEGTLLHHVGKLDAPKGQEEMAQYLIASGVPIDGVDTFGSTPLLEAARSGNADLVRLYLARGADAKHVAATGRTAMMNAAESGSVPIMQMLLQRGASINGRDNIGKSALDLARLEKQAAAEQFLLAHGAK